MTPAELRTRRLALGLGTPRMARVLAALLGRSVAADTVRAWEAGRRGLPEDVAALVATLTVETLPPEAAKKPPGFARKPVDTGL